MRYRSTAGKIADAINAFVLLLIALSMLFPFVYIFAVSFSSLEEVLQNELLLWPKEWVTDAYRYILSSEQFIRSFFVTVFVTVVGTFVNMAFTTTMAYGLSRPVPGQKPLLFMVVFTLLFSAGMIPTYMVGPGDGADRQPVGPGYPGGHQSLQSDRHAPILPQHTGGAARSGHHRRGEPPADFLADHPAPVQTGPGRHQPVLRRGPLEQLFCGDSVHQRSRQVAPAGGSSANRHRQ